MVNALIARCLVIFFYYINTIYNICSSICLSMVLGSYMGAPGTPCNLLMLLGLQDGPNSLFWKCED